jgi:glucose/mannose transport system substrate-binding protein
LIAAAFLALKEAVHMKRRLLFRFTIAGIAAVSLVLTGSPGVLGAPLSGKLEIFSWWTAGGEAEGLKALFDIYHKQYPAVNIVNATVAGGAGTNAKAVLKTRMLGGNPPDSFQVHAGHELIDTWVKTGYMEPVTGIVRSEGWDKVMPKGLIDILSYKGEIWSVPVNIHRANILWYNKKVLADAGLSPPATFDDFFKVADVLKARGVVAFALGDKEGWEAGHVFETVLIGTLGADGYRGLWTGAVPWTGPKVAQALETFKKMLGYINSDHAALTWDEAGQYITGGKGAMLIMGDWTNGWFTSKNFKDYGWAPAPGNANVYDALSDSFGLPKKVKDRANTLAFLRTLGSRTGQEAFNPLKGSICARNDCSARLFSPYQQWTMQHWRTDAIVPSVIHGAAASEGWATEYKDAVALFVTSRNVPAAQKALQKACVNAGICR